MQRTPIKIATVAVGVAFAATACGSSSNGTSSEPTTPSTTAAVGTAATATKAADLRAGLTYLLEEHVQLAGIATHTALVAGGKMDAPAVKAAVAALDANSIALSKAVGAAYPKAEAPFLASWRQHIGFFVDYTLGKATKNAKMVAKAKSDLDGYRTSFGQLINSVVPELPADAVAAELKPHVASLFAAIDAQVAGSPKQFQLLQDAAGHMPGTAAILAGGIASNLKLGKTDTPAADLRAGLTALLTQHVYAAGIAIDTAVSKGGNLKDPLVGGAVSALDANSVALSKAVGAAYPKAEVPFLASWRQHIGFFVNYTLGKATKNSKQVSMAMTDLDGYRTSFGQLINSVVPELPADAVANELKPHVASLFTAIDADVAGDPSVFGKLETAASHMPGTAATLAGGIAQNLKLS
ncbi:MAG: hypothetical protein JWN31_1447 [Frankiales bacterium]|nr:hypothetical protein [Frankiales bacterium]